jgi:hypothetical protein
MMPIRCDTAWGQETKPHVTGYIALPPDHADQIGKVIFRIIGVNGSTIGEYPGKLETFESEGSFQRMTAQWPSDLATPGAHQLLAIVYDKNGKELARVVPRMVSVNMAPGY